MNNIINIYKEIERLNKKIVGLNCGICGRCCKNCALFLGYFLCTNNLMLKNSLTYASIKSSQAYSKFELLKRQYAFNKHKGFLTKEGCCLPWNRRSCICLSYFCSELIKKNKDKVDKIRKLLEKVKRIRKGEWLI